MDITDNYTVVPSEYRELVEACYNIPPSCNVPSSKHYDCNDGERLHQKRATAVVLLSVHIEETVLALDRIK